jgi:hypothetical protein
MKALQVGILAALIVCAGLLYKVYRGQQEAPAPAAVPAQSMAEPLAPAASMPAPAAEPPAVPQPAPAQPAVAHERKPSPTRSVKAKAPETVAENRPAAEPAPPAPAPTPQPAPAAQPQPDPAAAHGALNPPAGTETAPPPPRVPHSVTIPAGTLISVRLAETLSSEKNTAGDAFSATLDQPIVIDGFAIAERGARVRGKVVEADRAGRIKGVAMLSVALTSMHTSDGQDVTLATESFVKEGPKSRGDDAKKVGVGAALGAAIGAIAGGGKGAAIGAGVGGAAGAGTVAATRGKASELPVETRLSFRLQEPVQLTERLR